MLKQYSKARFISGFIFVFVICIFALSFMFSQEFAQAETSDGSQNAINDGSQNTTKNSAQIKSTNDIDDQSDKIYNMSVGNSLVGADASLWVGTGSNRHYAYTCSDFSYEYYPSTNKLNLLNGYIDSYFTYIDQSYKQTLEGKGVICANDFYDKIKLPDSQTELNLTKVNDNLKIDFINCTNVELNLHTYPVEPYNKEEYKVYDAFGIFIKGDITVDITGDSNLDIYCSAGQNCSQVVGIFTYGDLNFVSKDNKNFNIYIHDLKIIDNPTIKSSTTITGIECSSFSKKGTIKFGKRTTTNLASFIIDCLDDPCSIVGILCNNVEAEENSLINMRNFFVNSNGDSSPILLHIYGINAFGKIINNGSININKDSDNEFLLNVSYTNDYEETYAYVDGIKVEDDFINNNYIYIGGLKIEWDFNGGSCEYLNNMISGIYDDGQLVLGKNSQTIYNENDDSYIYVKSDNATNADLTCYGIYARNSSPVFDNAYVCVKSAKIASKANAKLTSVGIISLGDEATMKDTICKVFSNTLEVDEIDSVVSAAFVCGGTKLSGSTRLLANAKISRDAYGVDTNNNIVLGDDSILESISYMGLPSIKGPYEQNDTIIKLLDGYKEYINFGPDTQHIQQSSKLDESQYSKPNSYFKIENANYVYNVYFDSQGGTEVADQSVHKGDLINPPASPEKDGNVFAGWYKEKDCQNAWDFSKDTVSTDTTLYAKWNIAPAPSPKDEILDNTAQTGDNNYLLMIIFGLIIIASLSVVAAHKKLYN